jgi:hypothetical protein
MATNIPVTTKSPTLSSDMGTLPFPKTDTEALAEKQKASLSGFAFKLVVTSSNEANTDAISLDNIVNGFCCCTCTTTSSCSCPPSKMKREIDALAMVSRKSSELTVTGMFVVTGLVGPLAPARRLPKNYAASGFEKQTGLLCSEATICHRNRHTI